MYEINSQLRKIKYPALFWRTRLLLIVYYLVVTMVPITKAVDTSYELRKQILSHYNKSVSSFFETSSSSDVGVILSPTRIAQFDESTSSMTVEAYAFVNWMDVRLRWDSQGAYENITWIPANVDDVWKPNMNVFNSGRANKYINTEMPIFILENGRVWWTLMGDFHFVCVQEDLRWYPLDTHTCKLSLGSLYPQDVYSSMMLDIDNTTGRGADTKAVFPNPHWQLLALGHSAGVASATVVMIYRTDDFTFKVRRLGWPLLATFLPLMLSFMFLAWTSLSLPPRGELLTKRMTVSTTSLFLSSVFLLVLIKTVPGIGSRPPVIVKIYTSVVFLEIFTCLHNVVMANILSKSSTHLGVLRKLPNQVQCILGVHHKSEASAGRKGLLENEETPPEVGLEQFQLDPGSEDVSNLVGTAYDRAHIFLQVTIVIILVAVFCFG